MDVVVVFLKLAAGGAGEVFGDVIADEGFAAAIAADGHVLRSAIEAVVEAFSVSSANLYREIFYFYFSFRNFRV